MSDYIYGSSLRAAKSKANYLFEGDFRRRPNQNLSGASRSVGRVDLLQHAAERRQTREDNRRKEKASLKIQSIWRGYRSRKQLAITLREQFDTLTNKVTVSQGSAVANNFDSEQFGLMSRQLIVFYHSEHDKQRFGCLINLMMQHQDAVINSKSLGPTIWLHRISKLLTMNLSLIEKNQNAGLSYVLSYLNFLDAFTRAGDILDQYEATFIWNTLIKHRLYSIMRQLATANPKNSPNDIYQLNHTNVLLKLIRRSLDTVPSKSPDKDAAMPSYCFFEQFLHEPLEPIIEDFYFTELLKSRPKHLEPRYILEAFMNSTRLRNLPSQMAMNFGPACGRPYEIQECKNTILLCYSFVKALHTRVDIFEDYEKVNYINIISVLIAPAEYITNISLMQAASNDSDQNDDDTIANNLNSSFKAHQLTQYHTETHRVITKTVDLINQHDHIGSLKSIIFSSQLQQQVQGAIVQICNLMLAHEYLAIFNCRLLYTVAFSKEFSRTLWRSIITTTNTTLYGTSIPIYMQIIRANQSINHESWKSILPKLKLFCSLSSYLLPTLDDAEFYTNDDNPLYASSNENYKHHQSNLLSDNNSTGPGSSIPVKESSGSMSSFYVDKELVGISTILRDMCVGLVEILYQGNRQSMNQHQSSMRFDTIGRVVGIGSIGSGNVQVADEQTRLISFEIRSCFQALVRFVCQLHARDSRKQFCPDGHWICPSVVIPANKAIDFQSVTSQQGRLLFQMTRDDQGADRLANLSSEVKTVLILQEIPFVIHFHDRVQIFHQLLRKERQLHQSEGYHFGLPGTAIQVQIRRNYLYEDAFEKLSLQNEPNMKLPLKVSLINSVGADEAGIDGGGLTKEFLGELLKTGFDPMRGFFKYTKDHFLYPNPSANVLFSNLREGYEVHYEFLGRMLGKAIFGKIMVELPMASFFLAKLLAAKHSSDVDLHNLESLDPVLYKNLVYLKNYKGDIADLNLDFTISNNELGEHEMVELKPNGSKIPVTRENKIEYVHLVADYRLNKQIRSQCAAFKRGLAQLIDLDWLRMFDPKELQILISGAPAVIDVADWRQHTIYCNGYSDTSEAIKTFWSVVEQFDETSKRKLLKFATSCSLPPLLGFKDLVPQFAIAPSEEERLPTASTCMNLLKLPQCEDEQAMRSKLLYAIESNSGFELS